MCKLGHIYMSLKAVHTYVPSKNLVISTYIAIINALCLNLLTLTLCVVILTIGQIIVNISQV